MGAASLSYPLHTPCSKPFIAETYICLHSDVVINALSETALSWNEKRLKISDAHSARLLAPNFRNETWDAL